MQQLHDLLINNINSQSSRGQIKQLSEPHVVPRQQFAYVCASSWSIWQGGRALQGLEAGP